MRLPWPFGRRTPSDGPSAGSPGGAAPAGPSAAPSPDRTAAPTGAWSSLPPIQRTVGAPPLVAPAAPFLEDVPGHRHLPPIVQPLGHETGPTAPPGLVVARPSAVPSLTSRAPMPVQRRATAPGAAPASDAWSEPAAAAPDLAPVRTLRAVAPSATVAPAPRPLTRAPASPAPVAQRSAAASATSVSGARPASPSAHAATTVLTAPGAGAAPSLPAPRGTAPARTSRWAERPTAGAIPAPGLGAPLPATPPATSHAPAAPASPPTSAIVPPAPAAASAPVSAPPAAGGSHGVLGAGTPTPSAQRRMGLGAPMSSPPSTSVAQRLPMATPAWRRAAPGASGPVPDAGPGGAPVGAGLAGFAGFAAPSVTGSSAAPAPASRPLPVLPVARRSSAPASASDAHAGHDHGPGTRPGGAGSSAGAAASAGSGGGPSPATPSPARASARPVPPVIRQTLGARPLRPSVAVQREAAGTTAAPAAPSAEPLPSPVAARWSPAGDLPATVEALPLAAHAEEAVPLQRLASGPATPAPTVPSAPVPMREMVFPAPGTASIPLAPFAGLGDAGIPTLQRAVADAGPSRTGLGAGSSHALLALAHPAATPASMAPASAAPAVQRIVSGDAAAAGAAPTVQASRPGGSPIPDISVRPVVQRADAGAAPAGQPGAGGGRSDKELDELAQALFGRFRTRLRSEVIQEREARGLGFDTF